MKLKFEIKAAEGGDDSKLLVKDLADIYIKYASKNAIKVLNYTEAKADVG